MYLKIEGANIQWKKQLIKLIFYEPIIVMMQAAKQGYFVVFKREVSYAC
jgi:hypothetical protein